MKNIKNKKTSKLRFGLKLLTLSSLILVSACEDTNPEDSLVAFKSAIQPAKLLVPMTEAINGLFPNDGSSVTKGDNLKFSWGAQEDIVYSAVILLDEIPYWKQGDNQGFKNLQSHCIGGVSELAGDIFFDQAVLTNSLEDSEFGICDTSSNNGLISPTKVPSSSRKITDIVTFSHSSLDTLSTIYWVVIGYDMNFKIIYSSSVNELNLEN